MVFQTLPLKLGGITLAESGTVGIPETDRDRALPRVPTYNGMWHVWAIKFLLNFQTVPVLNFLERLPNAEGGSYLLWGWPDTWLSSIRHRHHSLPSYKYSKDAGLPWIGCTLDHFPPTPDQHAGASNGSPDPRSRCPAGALYYKRRCYHFLSSPATWERAEVLCQALKSGAQLASVLSSHEGEMVSSYLKAKGASNVWTGLAATRSHGVSSSLPASKLFPCKGLQCQTGQEMGSEVTIATWRSPSITTDLLHRMKRAVILESLCYSKAWGQPPSPLSSWDVFLSPQQYMAWEWSDGSSYASPLWDCRSLSTAISAYECVSMANIQNTSMKKRFRAEKLMCGGWQVHQSPLPWLPFNLLAFHHAQKWLQRSCADTLPYLCKYRAE
ncbi:uncharacterized protein LOC129335762 [Eublepharis macularius]|uniref:Uncharacterized protein LOC129335762 n=1 Tax=Eublepharis macularius TaxID=481883 RepID=A0AA97JSK2_EUBMA|nr:uncharacterized protein LOC129335762 [Eublepharis macularius]